MSELLNDSDRVEITKMCDRPWGAVSNLRPCLKMRAANRFLLNAANSYVEREKCGVQFRVIRREDLPKYGIAYDAPGLSVASLLEADEHMAKHVVATGKLYQLPNGQWITPSMVSAVAVYIDPRSPFVSVCFRDDGGSHEIDCPTKESAAAMRDKIAADVNAMVGGAA